MWRLWMNWGSASLCRWRHALENNQQLSVSLRAIGDGAPRCAGGGVSGPGAVEYRSGVEGREGFPAHPALGRHPSPTLPGPPTPGARGGGAGRDLLCVSGVDEEMGDGEMGSH
jgi:hypothetical protein